MTRKIDVARHRIPPGEAPSLADRPTRESAGLEEADGRKRLATLQEHLLELQDLLYAERKRSVLVVLQAMDAIGKDSTIRRCFGPLNPQRCRTYPFKRPTDEELRRDFLWRAHQVVPARGMIHVWNRSHYEDVLVPAVMGDLPEEELQRRFAHINAFEALLADEGTAILKVYLHASTDYQRGRLERRLTRPDKRWKFEPADVIARARWDAFIDAYEAAITACNTRLAPWYVVPAERRWFRDLVIVQAVVDRLIEMDPRTPEVTFDPEAIDLDDPETCR